MIVKFTYIKFPFIELNFLLKHSWIAFQQLKPKFYFNFPHVSKIKQNNYFSKMLKFSIFCSYSIHWHFLSAYNEFIDHANVSLNCKLFLICFNFSIMWTYAIFLLLFYWFYFYCYKIKNFFFGSKFKKNLVKFFFS